MNHLRLLEALARLRDRDGLKLPFVFTGYKTDFWLCVGRRVDELGLGGQVSFLGLLPREDLSAFYRAAQFVFVPTRFLVCRESASMQIQAIPFTLQVDMKHKQCMMSPPN